MSTSEIVVREARPEDDLAIGELLVAAFVSTYARKMPQVIVTEARKDDLRDVTPKRVHERVLVAEVDGRVVGTLTLYRPFSPRSKTWCRGASEMRYMAVDPVCHKAGVADRLIEAALAQARLWNANSITLHVRQGAEGVARFYERHGWVRAPEGDRDERPVIFLEAFMKRLEPG